MSRMSDLATAMDDLKRCRQLLDGVEETLREMFGGEEKKEEKYTLAEVRRVLVEKSRAGHAEEVKAMLARHGADRLSDISETEYPAMMREAGSIA